MATILVVDDELGIRDLLSEILNDEGHTVELAENAAQARSARAMLRPDLVLLDIWMPDTDGVTLLKEWSSTGLLTMPVIMMSGHATIDTAVEATRIGATAFLEKPITMAKLLKAVDQGLNRSLCQIRPHRACLCHREPALGRPHGRSRHDRRQPAHPGDGPRPAVVAVVQPRRPAARSRATNSRRPTSNTTWPRSPAP